MGYYADRSKGRGQLYLVTREEEPFCAHQYHVKLETVPTSVPIKSYGKIQITLIGESSLNETFTMTKKDDEEMTLGQSISRILVPHPILAQLTRIEILYTAYTGWLSSGLTQWKLDKVTLMDSFGRISSVCRKSMILESGVPVNLRLYPKDCTIPSEEEAEDRIQYVQNSLSNETGELGELKVEQKTEKSISSFRDALNFFNIPWRNDKENNVIDEGETSRAFNTRTVKIKDKIGDDFSVKEIVEPILKPHSSKNARSHDPNKEKGEITEPILGPTTAKNNRSVDKQTTVNSEDVRRVVDPSSYDSKGSGSEWVPKEIPVNVKTERKLNQGEDKQEFKRQENPLEQIASTVQFIPNRLARMFEQAEKYARDTILPLVSTYTPRFISDIITPKEEKKYVPLKYEEHLTKAGKMPSARVHEAKSLQSISVSQSVAGEPNDFTTPYSHIQKINKKRDNEKTEMFQESASFHVPAVIKSTTPKMNLSIRFESESGRKARDEENVSNASTNKNSKAIYINLPVFKEDPKKIKYIPLNN